MDIKLKNKFDNKKIYIAIFIMSIYLLALSLMSSFDFLANGKYISINEYFHSYNFKDQFFDYFEIIKNHIEADSNNQEIKKDIDSNEFIRYYIEDIKSKKIYTNLEDVYDVKDYIKSNALYSMELPSSDLEGYYWINNWFETNSYKGTFIFKEVNGYSQLQKDYEYFISIRERVLKEGAISIISLIVGLVSLIYIIKIKKQEIYFVNEIEKWYIKIPLDFRICSFFIGTFLAMIYMFEISFFYMPIDISHFLKLTLSAIYVLYLVINIKVFLKLLKDSEELEEQWRNSFIYQLILLFKEASLMMLRNGIIVFTLTVLLGGFIFLIIIGIKELDEIMILVCGSYILLYVIFVMNYVLKKVVSLNKIIKGSDEIVSGNLDYTIEEEGKGELAKLAYNINNMKEGFKNSVEGQVKSERLKSELITNVSHDLKTPLTLIINYINLLKKEDLSKEKMLAYIQVLDRNSQRLKILIDDLFEASKMTSGSVELNIERVDLVAILRQSLGEVYEKTKNSSLTFKVNMPKNKIYLNLDGKKIWRVFENLIGNILKYSQPNTRVYIDLKEEDNKVMIIMKNISLYEMDFDVNEIFERFKRGDKSRSTEGSGLGLAIARSIVELHGGTMNIAIDGDLFKVSVEFYKDILIDD